MRFATLARLSTCCLLLIMSVIARAVGGPENVLLVVNADNPESVLVANEYARLRQIPAGNVLHLRDLPPGTTIKVDDFRLNILIPILDAIRERGLAGQIGELVYCLHKMGFSAGEETYSPPTSSRFKGFPYAHLKAFLSHPFSVMRHFCGDVTHVQAFVNRPGFRRRASDVMLSTVSIHVRFANDCVGYLLSQRGDATYGLGGWWSLEVAGTRGTFCIENCIEKLTFWPGPSPQAAGSADKPAGGPGAGPEVMNTGITDFGQTFPRRIHAFLEDITNEVALEDLRASGRDALAALEYTWAVIESYEEGGALVRPHALPPLHGDPRTLPD